MWHKLHDFNLTCPVHTSSIGPELMRMRQLSRSLMLQGVKLAPEIKIEDTWELLSGQRLALLTSGMARYDAMVHCYLACTQWWQSVWMNMMRRVATTCSRALHWQMTPLWDTHHWICSVGLLPYMLWHRLLCCQHYQSYYLYRNLDKANWASSRWQGQCACQLSQGP